MTAHRKPVFGVGINDWVGSTKLNERPIWNYKVWQNMLERCYSQRFKEKRPTYRDTSCDLSWLSLSKFTSDIIKVPNWEKLNGGWALDKDIIGGCNHYSLETVCVIPLELNNLLITHESTRGEYPIGVCYCKRDGKYKSTMKKFNKTVNLGRYLSIQEAHETYLEAKQNHIRFLGSYYRGTVDDKVCDVLSSYVLK